MCMTLLAGATIGSSLIGASSARSASRSQERSANNQVAENRRVYDQQTQFFSPYRQSGENALDAYNYELGLGNQPSNYRGFEATPGYQFRMDQGQSAIDGSAASRGQLFSGATLRAQQEFGQGLASQEYNNYLNRIGGQAQAGQAAAGQQAAAAGNMGMANNQAIAARGNAQAAGAIGVGNALNSGISNGIGLYQYQNQLNAGGQNAVHRGIVGY